MNSHNNILPHLEDQQCWSGFWYHLLSTHSEMGFFADMPRKPKIEVYVGFKINRLTLLEFSDTIRKFHPNGRLKGTIPMAKWKCECGNVVTLPIGAVRSGKNTKSCGCLLNENQRTLAQRALRTHGKSKTRDYTGYQGMLSRCRNPNDPKYARYGGRGIRVCERWIGEQGFEKFLSDMGPRPNDLTIDRIDNNGNYEPSNCRWATKKQQARNTSSNRIIDYAGKRMCLSEFAELFGFNPMVIKGHFNNGKSAQDVLDYYEWKRCLVARGREVFFRNRPNDGVVRKVRRIRYMNAMLDDGSKWPRSELMTRYEFEKSK